MLLSLAQLLLQGRHPEHPVCHTLHGTLRWREFSDRLGRLIAYLYADARQRWLLANDDAEVFVLWLLALLAAGKQIVIPPNFQPGTLEQLAIRCDATAGNVDIGTLPLTSAMAENIAAASIELYTSGSSGESKCIIKTPDQLEREVSTLEAQWGATTGAASVVATVPHHHIYGLLFRLLWPLAAGRPFDTVQCIHPDTLQQRIALLGDTVLVASPAQLARMPQLIELEKIAPWPRRVFSSGGPLPLRAAEALRGHCGSAPIEVYGSTETGGMAWRDQTEGEWWTPFPGIALESETNGALVHSPFLAPNIAHRLGDAIELSQDGRFKLLGRTDRIVKVEEKRLSLPDMEYRMQEHPWVAQAAAVLLSGVRQSIGMAVALTAEGKTALTLRGRQDMRAQLREHLAQYFDAVLLPRYWRYLDALPYTPQGKLPAAALLTLFAE
ncbi:MAG TPA: AMP-binding protein [Rhodocyclaceae bacterium]|nr:AMP-binding protein [Rhodocyclaceae bacterium]